ncbi:GCN5-related N-acetyltransferase [Calothrix parasitica NIES-267]|uniref:GCN5-related N-acetyltransferase n=1 Tax=Calothrix parasitica NIES-267 TaxID=1973488 RepID=A0A1Z4LW55_9CYAN|nr:GCN5-related N-acetyltransferase [Calothrix parasitica NIES-267]
MQSEQPSVIIRPACSEDSERISSLCEQLGYSASEEDIKNRLFSLQEDDNHIIYVATLPNNSVVGWVHAHKCHLIIMSPQVLIFGLVVDINYRSNGIGGLLMQQIEKWATINDCQTIRLRSNIIRKEAHKFYERMGYKNTKHSLEFCKNLI